MYKNHVQHNILIAEGRETSLLKAGMNCRISGHSGLRQRHLMCGRRVKCFWQRGDCMGREFVEKVEASPIIAAVKNDEELKNCLKSEIDVVFILYGDVVTIPAIIDRIKDSGRTAMVHLDLVSGLMQKEISLDFIRYKTRADGIITTRANLIHHAKELGLSTVLRFFILDSLALSNIEKLTRVNRNAMPDVIEILPGIIVPKIMRKISAMSCVPVIAGGLIKDREDVMNMLNNGAVAISTSARDVWFM